MSEQAEQKPGFEIKDIFYPWPSSFRLGDAVLVEQVTGLNWPAFTERLPEEEDMGEIAGLPEEAEDLVVLTGLIAAAIWQRHPTWRRDRTVRYVEQLELEKIQFVGGDEPEPEADARPPEPPPEPPDGERTSETSATPSSEEPESPSAESPSGTGVDGSTTGAPDSPPSE